MWRKLWNDGRRIDIMSASVDEAYAPDEPIMIGISSVEILKRKKRRKIVEHMSFMKSPVLRLLSMKGKII